MAKDYSKGQKLGQQDGATGDNKLAFRSFKRLITEVGSWLPGADNRDAEFRAGYKDGFRDRVRTLQTTPAETATSSTHRNRQNQPANGGSMSHSTSFRHQVELLQGLKQYLSDFQERLLGVSSNYQRKLDELHSAGLMDETYKRYVERELAETQAMIKRLVDHIDANDIPTVERETSYLEQKL